MKNKKMFGGVPAVTEDWAGRLEDRGTDALIPGTRGDLRRFAWNSFPRNRNSQKRGTPFRRQRKRNLSYIEIFRLDQDGTPYLCNPCRPVAFQVRFTQRTDSELSAESVQ